MNLRFLGTHDAESKTTRLASFVIDDVLAVDAGSLVSELTFEEQTKIEAILLSHGHYDHIRAVPAFAFNNSHRTVKVLATSQTLEILSAHFINGIVYPEFASDASFLGKAALQLVPIEPFNTQAIQGYKIMALPVVHPISAVGFGITSSDGKSIFYTGDTGPGLLHLWEYIAPQLLVADVTFPNRLRKVAKDAGHLCPEMLKAELLEFHRIKGYTPKVVAIHLSPQFEQEIAVEIEEVANKLGVSISVAGEGEKLVL